MLKRFTIGCMCIIFSGIVHAQFDKQLCKANEETVFAFQLKNKKWISVCRDKNKAYLVYRFGTRRRIELQYPGVLDSTSWQKFTFNGYSRGGGKQNAAMRHAFLNFHYKSVNYEVYETWDAEDDQEKCGIAAGAGKNTVDLPGNVKSRKGNLLQLLDEEKIKRD